MPAPEKLVKVNTKPPILLRLGAPYAGLLLVIIIGAISPETETGHVSHVWMMIWGGCWGIILGAIFQEICQESRKDEIKEEEYVNYFNNLVIEIPGDQKVWNISIKNIPSTLYAKTFAKWKDAQQQGLGIKINASVHNSE